MLSYDALYCKEVQYKKIGAEAENCLTWHQANEHWIEKIIAISLNMNVNVNIGLKVNSPRNLTV